MKLAIAIPTYNESANIKKLLPAIKKNLRSYPDLITTIFVVDDNSPDGTAFAAEEQNLKLADSIFGIEVLQRKKKEGLGKAYIYAFKKILPKNYDFILQMDADLSHDPKYLPAFLEATQKADMIIGSRYINGGRTPDWTFYRRFLSQGGNLYARLFLGSKITDYTGGYNMYSMPLLKKIDIKTLNANGYEFQIELKYKALKNCNDVVQVPIVFVDRRHGQSKIPRSTILKTLALVPKIALKRKSYVQ